MNEEVIDVILRIAIPGDVIDEEYSLVVTNQRTILVPSKSHSDVFHDWFFGGFVLAVIGYATARRKYLEDKSVDPETLGRSFPEKKNQKNFATVWCPTISVRSGDTLFGRLVTFYAADWYTFLLPKTGGGRTG